MSTLTNNRVKFLDETRLPTYNDYDDTDIDRSKYIDNQNYGLEQNSDLDQNQALSDTDQYDSGNEKQSERQVQTRHHQEPIYHFQTKIKNSGFWGKVKLRNGTKLLLVSLVLFVIAIVLIGVFWGFWYSHPLNYPMRILAITFLSMSILFFILGLVSNYFMSIDPDNKRILGSPFRRSTYGLVVSFFGLVVASDLITMYYSYWHNRWVNTPMIIIAIILYFFCGIGLIVSLRYICLRMINPQYDELRKEAKKSQKSKAESETESESDQEDEIEAEAVNNESNYETKKDFRKKVLKLTPRPVVNTTQQLSEYNEV